MKSRGQAALEFLSTYGFAFLIILVMIGALAYFGVLNPTNFLPERCLFGSEFACDEYQLIGNGTGTTVTVVVVNNVGEPININDFNASTDLGNSAANCLGGAVAVGNGDSAQLSCDIPTAAYADNEKVSVDLEVIYTEQGGTLTRKALGEVFATVQ